MAIVGFQLRLSCGEAICAIRPSCPCGGTAKLGEDHLHTLTMLNNLAMLLQAQGQLAEAEPLYREALKKSPGAQPQRFQRGFGQWIWGHTLLDFRWSIRFLMTLSGWFCFFFVTKVLKVAFIPKCLENSKVH